MTLPPTLTTLCCRFALSGGGSISLFLSVWLPLFLQGPQLRAVCALVFYRIFKETSFLFCFVFNVSHCYPGIQTSVFDQPATRIGYQQKNSSLHQDQCFVTGAKSLAGPLESTIPRKLLWPSGAHSSRSCSPVASMPDHHSES